MSLRHQLATRRNQLVAQARQHRANEDGAIIIFSLFMLVLILWFGGMAVDYMRFETTRAKLQATLDRAVLAAADLDQTMPPADVVVDYFEKAGLDGFLDGDPVVLEGLNYRIVTANAEAEMPMLFADLPRVFMDPFSPGLTSLSVSGSSTAEERVSNVEVSLVLDVSGSMLRNNRFTNLVPAAHDFIDTIMANNGNDAEGLVTMSIVAYSAVVNPSDALANYFTLSNNHNYSNCMRIDDDLFSQTSLPFAPDTGAYERIGHFDYGASTTVTAHPIQRPWCFQGTENAAVIHQTDEQTLKDMVTNLEPFGNTAIDLGMKWGVALIDPAMRNAVTGLVASGDAPNAASGRPLDYDDNDGVLKVAVVMTDGENTTEYDIAEPYRTEMSTVWFWRETPGQALYDVPEDRRSIQYQGTSTATRSDDRFYYPDSSSSNRWGTHPRGYPNYRSETEADAASGRVNGSGIGYDAPSNPGSDTNIWHASWQDIYAGWVRTYIYDDLFWEAYQRGYISYNTTVATYYSMEEIVVGNEADDRLSDICAAARGAGIVVYTMAFEAPSGGQQALLDCASSPNHFFDVDGTDISQAFSAIASDIRNLKLTQ